MSARREVLAAVADRYRAAGRREKGRILDELCATTGWHRKHALRALSRSGSNALSEERSARRRGRKHNAIKDTLIALWEASDRVCGKRLVVMIPTLLPALERHGRLRLGEIERTLVLAVSAATIDRLLGDVKVAAAGGRRRRAGFYSAIRREVPIRTFNDWNDPPPGFCEIDMVAHGGTSVAGSFIQTLTMVDVATGWTECLPLIARDGGMVVEAIRRAQSLFPWLLRGADFANDSTFMNDVVVPWCRAQKIEVTRSRAYKKNDQAFVEQKNGAVVRRLVGYGRYEGPEAAHAMARLYAAARLYVNFFQPSFKRREGAGHQALSRSGDAVRACTCASEGHQSGQGALTGHASHARPRDSAGRDARRPGRTRRTHRPTSREEHGAAAGAGRYCRLCEDARHICGGG